MKVAVVGAGSIGIAFALVFARAGHDVALHDPDVTRRDVAKTEVAARLRDLASHGLFEGDIDAVLGKLSIHAELETALKDADYVQENAPERLDLKQALFSAIEISAPRTAILATSSSAITGSAIAGGLVTRERCLVVHPGNPPFLIPVVELVPAAFTSPETVDRAEAFLTQCGLSPVRITREIEGFVFNRLQGAMLREAYCLVRDGVISPTDLDRVVRDGLGLRWSVIGPFETADLNTRGGIPAHAARMGAAYARMGAERGQNDPWTDDLVAEVDAARRTAVPLDQWEARVRWRDKALMSQLKAREDWPNWPEAN